MKTLSYFITIFLAALFLGSTNLNPGDDSLRIISYKVQRYDSIAAISDKFNVSEYSIVTSNNIYNNRMRVGQILLIPNKNLTLYRYGRKANLRYLAWKFYTLSKHIKVFSRSLQPVKVHGNDKVLPKGGYVAVKQLFEKEYVWPSETKTVSSGYGWRRSPFNRRKAEFHTGIDIPSPTKRIYASKSGKVVYAGWLYGYGRTIIILHKDNTKTLYGHLSYIYFRKNTYVKVGLVIGKAGSTGRSTGNHLHFEIRNKNNSPVNPFKHLYPGILAEKGRI